MTTIISRVRFIFIIVITFTFVLSGKVFAAGLPYDVTAGHLATPLNVSWQVIGGSQTCKGTTGYPPISGGSADQINVTWQSGVLKPSVGTMSITDVYADPGNVVGGYKDYSLICKDQTSGEFDTVVLRVHNPCTAISTWNSLSHSCVANAVAPTISSFTGSSVVNYGNTATLSYSVSGATSCDINGISVSGGTYTTPALTSTSNFTLTCSNAGLSTVNGPITVTVASGSFTAPTGGTSCSIARGLSYCQTTLAWNSVNMSSPAIQNGAGTTLSTAASNAGMIANVKYSGDTFTLKNGSVNHDSRTVSAPRQASSRICRAAGRSSHKLRVPPV